MNYPPARDTRSTTPLTSAAVAVFTAFFAIFCPILEAYATPFSNPQFGFSLTIPDEFEKVELKTRGVALALRARANATRPASDSFPTVTVTIHPTILSLAPEYIAQRINEILDSYHSIGFPNARELFHDVRGNPQGRQYLLVALEYPREDGRILQSRIALVPGEKMHYILTFIDHQQGGEMSMPLFQQIIDSFEIQGAPKAPPGRKNQPRDRWALLFYVVIGALALIFLTRYQKRRPSKSS